MTIRLKDDETMRLWDYETRRLREHETMKRWGYDTMRLLDYEASFGALGASLGSSWSPFDSSWGLLEPLWGLLDGSWELLGSSWGCLGRSWAHLGRHLDAIWKKPRCDIFVGAQLGSQNPPKLAPKAIKNRCEKTNWFWSDFFPFFLSFIFDF